MSEIEIIDYGPLKSLIGTWKGNKGMDIAPESNATEENPYYETLVYTEGGSVTNAESQTLSIVHYRQIVTRKSNDEVFHDETGYWLWDPREKVVMHSLVIPRGVCLLAGGKHNNTTNESGEIVIEVEAGIDNEDWGIVQSPFMKNNAKTTSFKQKIVVKEDRMIYHESTMLDIYGRIFDHTDDNELVKE